MNKFSKIFITFYWAFFIGYLLLFPFPPSQGYGVSYADKLVHFFIFGVMAYLSAVVVEIYSKDDVKAQISVSLIITIIYSWILEYAQNFVPGRTVTFNDTLAALFGIIVALTIYYLTQKAKPKLLLHVCCIACGAYVARLLSEKHRVTIHFYNPNIYPDTEYFRRLEETKRVAAKLGIKVITGEYAHPVWRELVRGHEDDPEKGERCLICYRERLEATARLAREKKFAWFASTLSVSPHKLADELSRIGWEAAEKYGVGFYDRDFKKQDGFRKSLEVSKEFDLYRQDYCGCEFSLRQPSD